MTDRVQFNERMQALIDEIHAAPPATGSTGVLLPGEREFQTAREADLNGVALPADVRARLREAAELASVTLPAEV
jgi:LDH2 family malate/lactate/ureidoglycolate dehydrogenase